MTTCHRVAAGLAAIVLTGHGVAGSRVEQAFVVGMLRPEFPFIVTYDGAAPVEPITLAYDAHTKTFATVETRWLVSGAKAVDIKLAGAPALVSDTNRIPLRVRVSNMPVDDIHPVTVHANPSEETKISIFVTGSGKDHAPGTYRGSVTILFDSK